MTEQEIGKLIVRLMGDVGQYVSSMTHALNHTYQVTHQIEHQVEHMGHHVKEIATEMAMSFGVAFGIEQGIEHIKEAAEEVIQLTHAADRLGISVNTFQDLGYAAKQVGMESGSVEHMIMRMQRNLSEAASGSRQASEGFKRLGLDAKEMIDQPVEETVQQIANKMSEMENATDKAGVSMKIFGRGGAASVLWLKKLSGEGLKEASAELERFGMHLNEDGVGKLEQAHLATLKLEMSTKSLYRTIAIEAAPQVELISTYWAEFFASSNKMEQLGQATDQLGKSLGGLKNPLFYLIGEDGFAKLGAWIGGTTEATKEEAEESKKATESMMARQRQVRQLTEDVEKLTESLIQQNEQMGVSAPQKKVNELSRRGATEDQLAEAQAAIDQMKEKENTKAVDDLTESLTLQIEAFGKMGHELEFLKMAKKGVAEADIEALRILDQQLQAKHEQDALTKSVKELTESLEDQVLAFGKVGDSVAILKLKQKGATDDQLAAAKAASEHLEELKKHEAIMKKGEATTKQYASPQEKLKEQTKELDEQLKEGAITAETYRLALEAMTKKDYHVKMSTSGSHAIAAGSAEAMSAMYELGTFDPSEHPSKSPTLSKMVKHAPKKAFVNNPLRKNFQERLVAGMEFAHEPTPFQDPEQTTKGRSNAELDRIARAVEQVAINTAKQLEKEPIEVAQAGLDN